MRQKRGSDDKEQAKNHLWTAFGLGLQWQVFCFSDFLQLWTGSTQQGLGKLGLLVL